MSVLPFALPTGVLTIYGIGEPNSASGIIAPDNYKFGTVYQIYDGGGTYFDLGQQIMFDEKDVIDRLVYNGVRWTLLPARLVTDDTPISPP